MFRDLKISFFLAHKSITRGNKGTLALTILIMTLAFVNLIFISSIFVGFIVAMNEGKIENEISNIVIEPGKDEDYIEHVQSIQDKISTIPGVQGSSAHYFIGAIENYDENKDGKDIKSTSRPIKSINP
jgi:putative ABC transport system permease protein